MVQHARLKVDINVQVYFRDPQSPWQRGINEKTNGLLASTSSSRALTSTRIALTHSRQLTQPSMADRIA